MTLTADNVTPVTLSDADRMTKVTPESSENPGPGDGCNACDLSAGYGANSLSCGHKGCGWCEKL